MRGRDVLGLVLGDLVEPYPFLEADPLRPGVDDYLLLLGLDGLLGLLSFLLEELVYYDRHLSHVLVIHLLPLLNRLLGLAEDLQ